VIRRAAGECLKRAPLERPSEPGRSGIDVHAARIVCAGAERLRGAPRLCGDRPLSRASPPRSWALGPAAAPPWQSVYLDREQVVMGEETIRVRTLFARFGLVSTLTDQQPEDHLGLQLQFLAALAARTAERLAAGDEPGARTLLEGMCECLEAHLLRWVGEFVDLAEAASESGFYAGLSRLTLGLLRFDLDDLRRPLAESSLI
jgi:hypothetical protein